MKKKTVALLMACVMLMGVAIGGTLAWLTASTKEVTNTFTDSDINITLSESSASKEFQMIPGHIISKDPKVTVAKNSEACWLFIKITESTTPALKDYIEYELASGWQEVSDNTLASNVKVYARQVGKASAEQPFNILKDNQVQVSVEVDKDMMDAIDADNEAKPTLSFDACAVQLYKSLDDPFGESEAYAKVVWHD